MDDEFIRIFNLYKNDIYRLSYSYTKNISDSDDVVQNTFIKLYKNNELLEKSDKEIKKWLIRVAINECKNLILSSWKKKITALTDREENIGEKVDHNEILDAVFKLPKKYRIVLYLYYYEGYKVKEISSILKISESNIQVRLLRARKQLKEILKETYNYEG